MKNWILKWIVKTSIKSYIEMAENKMWQNPVEMKYKVCSLNEKLNFEK